MRPETLFSERFKPESEGEFERNAVHVEATAEGSELGYIMLSSGSTLSYDATCWLSSDEARKVADMLTRAADALDCAAEETEDAEI